MKTFCLFVCFLPEFHSLKCYFFSIGNCYIMEVILQGNKLPKDKVLLQSATGKTRKKNGSVVICFQNVTCAK